MKISNYCIKNQLVCYILATTLLVIGVLCFYKLPVTALPTFHVSKLRIITSYPGATSQFMEDAITSKIENTIRDTKGIDELQSVSSTEKSVITITFKPGVDSTHLETEIDNKLSMIKSKLPPNAASPQVILDNDSDSNTIEYIGVFGKNASLPELTNYANLHIVPTLRTIKGVDNITIQGQEDYAVRVWLNVSKMAMYKITPQDVFTALDNNINQNSGGIIHDNLQSFTLHIAETPDSVNKLNSIIIKRNPGNTAITLGDIAKIALGSMSTMNHAYVNGIPGIMLTVLPMQEANSIHIANVVKKSIQQMQSTLPKGVHAKILFDQSNYIKHSIHEVYKAIILATLLVAAVMLFFLGSLRLFLIPLIIIPICLVGGFLLIYLMGFSINIMTLLAIILSVGLVVDDAIVVLENTIRNLKDEPNIRAATRHTIKEIGTPIIAMTCTLLVVYLPILFTNGFTADLIRPFTYTLAAIVVLSGILSLTLTPATICSRIINKDKLENKFTFWMQGHFNKIQRGYKRILIHTLRHKVKTLIICLIFAGIGIFCFMKMGSSLLPSEDYGKFATVVRVANNDSPSVMQNNALYLNKLATKNPNIASSFAMSDFEDSNVFSLSFLKPAEQRSVTTTQVMNKVINHAKSEHPTTEFDSSTVPLFNAAFSDSDIEMVVTMNSSYTQLNKTVQNIIKSLKQYPGITQVTSDLSFNNQQLNITINRPLAMHLGVPISTIAQSISLLYGGKQTQNEYVQNSQNYPVITQLPLQQTNNLTALQQIFVRSITSHQLIPLSTLITVNNIATPASLAHYNGLPATIIHAEKTNGYDMSAVLHQMMAIANKTAGHQASFYWLGSTKQFLTANSSTSLFVILSILAIFLVLTLQFGSLADSAIILMTIPLTFIGAIITLYIFGGDMNLFTKVGLLTLIGLITKHGILITDFANKKHTNGISIARSITSAATLRLRPILMTSLAMILGSIPLVLCTGEGAHSMQEIGLVLSGGLFFGTLCSLFIVPLIYLTIKRTRITSDSI
jgi:multidrug efflux pump